jgi:membrane fusion protein (multidrug efflux system)
LWGVCLLNMLVFFGLFSGAGADDEPLSEGLIEKSIPSETQIMRLVSQNDSTHDDGVVPTPTEISSVEGTNDVQPNGHRSNVHEKPTLILPGELVQGFTAPIRLASVAAAEQGVIHEIAVSQGQTVKKGDVLAILDHTVLAMSLELAKERCTNTAKRDAAIIELKLRQKRCDNLQTLGEGLTTPEELDRATADRDSGTVSCGIAAEKDIRLDELERRKIEAELNRRTIRSPIDGVVIRVHRELGEFVSPSDPVVVTVADLSGIRIVLHPPARVTEDLKSGDVVLVRLKKSNEVVSTRVDFVSPLTDADSGSVRLELTSDNPGGRIQSGIRCELSGSTSVASRVGGVVQ